MHWNNIESISLLVSQTVGFAVSAGITPVLGSTLWDSGSWTNGTDAVGTVPSSTNLVGNAGFVNPLRGDYHIVLTSESLDAGVHKSVATDTDGDWRPADQEDDIGADESWRRVFRPVSRATTKLRSRPYPSLSTSRACQGLPCLQVDQLHGLFYHLAQT
jgi:hypothetical protein